MKLNQIAVRAVGIFALLFFPISLIFADVSVPNQPSIVSIHSNDRRLFVRDRRSDGTLGDEYAYVMRGVNWSPTSGTTDPNANPNVFQQEFINFYVSDIQKMVAMGVNTVRVYHDFGTGAQATQILDEFYRNGIKVIVQVDSPRHGSVANTANISAVVSAYKNHPAILMWAVGTEWDINHYYGVFSTLQQSAQFTEQSAQLIKTIDTNHPVCTYAADPHIPNVHILSQDVYPTIYSAVYMKDIVGQMVPSVDVWGVNIYRGNSFGDVFQMWRAISNKPMFVGEFGADAYDHRISAENQQMQSNADTTLWDEIYLDLSAERFSGTAIGGTVFEWNDEWWKNGSPTVQQFSFEGNGGQPDGFNDEEWFGIAKVDRTLRSVYFNLQNHFLNGQSAILFNNRPTLKATSNTTGIKFEIDNKLFISRAGGAGGARGMNIAILDSNTGVRMKEVKNIDTWAAQYWGGPHFRFAELANYLNGLPNGSIILLAVGDEGGFINPNTQMSWNDSYVEQGFQVLEALGSTQIRNIKAWGSWSMIAIKGQGKLAEAVQDQGIPAVSQAQVSVTLNPNADRRDTTPPQIIITSIIPQYTNQSPLVVSYTVDGTPKQMSFNLQEGVNNLSIVEVDQAGNQTTYRFLITRDTIPPTGSININSGASSTNTLNVTLNLSATDSGSGVDKMSFSFDQASWTTPESYATIKQIALPNNASQTKTVYVKYYDKAGLVSSVYSKSIIFNAASLDAPVTLRALPTSTTQINLTWVDNSNNESGFKVERGVSSNGTIIYSQIGTTNANITSLSDSGRTPNTIYYYRVRAYNSAGDSNYSNRITAMTPGGASHIWQNQLNPFDVNQSGSVTPQDALFVINRLLTQPTGVLTGVPATPPIYYDVNGDGSVSSLDALLVINYLLVSG